MKIIDTRDLSKLKYNDKVELQCYTCGNSFYKTKHEVNKAGSQYKNPKPNKYCSKECQSRGQKTTVKVNCKNCGKEFEKTNSQIKRHPNSFCSQSCNAIYNNAFNANLIASRKKPQNVCKEEKCNVNIRSEERYCNKHNPIYIARRKIINSTIADYERLSGRHANKYAGIRDIGKRIAYKSGLLTKCFLCDFDKVVECCHIKSISDWDKSTLILEVNHKSNLIGLCPNHHYCFDKGKLEPEEQQKIDDELERKKLEKENDLQDFINNYVNY